MKKLAIWAGIAIVGVIGIAALASGNTTVSPTPAAAIQATQQQATPTTSQVAPTQPVAPSNTSLSNNNYYTNVSGNTVHSPAYSSTGAIPSGATAECGDGTYSFSQHRSGTCSHHGGVSQWLQ